MKKLFLSLLAVFALSSTGYPQTNASVNTSKFGQEVNLSLATSYALDASKPFRDKYDFNLVVNSQVYLNRYFGVEASLPFILNNETSVSEVWAGGLVRVPVLDSLAGYLGAGAIYQWDDENYDYYGKVGAELRLIDNVGFFGEGIYTINELNKSVIKDGNWRLQAGIRVSF